LNYCVLSIDPVCVVGASGSVAPFLVQQKKSKLPYGFFTMNGGESLSPCKFIGEIMQEVNNV